MVGSDVCGYAGNTWQTVCSMGHSRAFYPFYVIMQSLYLEPGVLSLEPDHICRSEGNDTRYRLLDYLYTNFHEQTVSGKQWFNLCSSSIPKMPTLSPSSTNSLG